MFKHPEYFWDMSGKEYGLDEDFKVLAPAFKFEKSNIGWDIPTGRRGRSKADVRDGTADHTAFRNIKLLRWLKVIYL